MLYAPLIPSFLISSTEYQVKATDVAYKSRYSGKGVRHSSASIYIARLSGTVNYCGENI
jgi:hypothetical protein